MPIENHEHVAAAFLGVVEKLTFMFGEVVPVDDLELPTGKCAEAWLLFSGDVRGRLAIAVPQELTPEIAGNILGLDPEDLPPGEMMIDALGELLNVVSGHVVMALAGPQANFGLSAPQHRVIDARAFRALCHDQNSATFMLDDWPVLLNLTLE